jgi:hypothetical protein
MVSRPTAVAAPNGGYARPKPPSAVNNCYRDNAQVNAQQLAALLQP